MDLLSGTKNGSSGNYSKKYDPFIHGVNYSEITVTNLPQLIRLPSLTKDYIFTFYNSFCWPFKIIILYAILVSVLICVFLPESPRYLVQQQKSHEAFLVLKKIARINGTKDVHTLEQDNSIQLLLQRSQADFKIINSSIIQKFNLITHDGEEGASDETSSDTPSAFKFILKTKKNFFQTLLLILIWFFTTMSFAGKL